MVSNVVSGLLGSIPCLNTFHVARPALWEHQPLWSRRPKLAHSTDPVAVQDSPVHGSDALFSPSLAVHAHTRAATVAHTRAW